MMDRRRRWGILGMNPGATAGEAMPVEFPQAELCLSVGDTAESLPGVFSVPILISNNLRKFFVLLNETVFYDIDVSRKIGVL